MQVFFSSLRRAFSQPAFVVVAIILLAASVTLNGATEYLQLHFKKLAVPPAQPLAAVPKHLGRWLQVSIDEPLAHEFQEVLGTERYVFRDYVDTRAVKQSDIDAFEGKSPLERKKLAAQLQNKNPAAVVNLSLTYYTGLVDTVAHVPDRCYVADGFEPSSYDVVSWDALRGKNGDGQVRFIVFEDSVPGRSVAKNVAYFFNCNGQYMNDPIAVRTTLASLRQKYGYYMKIELQTIILPSKDATKVMNDFLTSGLPEFEKCLPDWAALTAQH